jgi:plasmid maintenance system antidote protein VapI
MLNVEMFKELVKKRFNNNYTNCAKEIGVSTSTISRIINGKTTEASTTFIKLFSEYCKKNRIDVKKYIFLA